jgi:hypothetical protein
VKAPEKGGDYRAFRPGPLRLSNPNWGNTTVILNYVNPLLISPRKAFLGTFLGIPGATPKSSNGNAAAEREEKTGQRIRVFKLSSSAGPSGFAGTLSA